MPVKLIESKICSIEGCNKEIKAKDLCEKHYLKEYRESNRGYCENEVCGKHAVLRNGLCEVCYKAKLYGAIGAPKPKESVICSVEDCKNLVHSMKYCSAHYRHYNLYGKGKCSNINCTYISVLFKGKCTRCLKKQRVDTEIEKEQRCSVKKCTRLKIDGIIIEGKELRICDLHLKKLEEGKLEICKLESCNNLTYSREFCYNHYTQYQRWQSGQGKHPEELLKCKIHECNNNGEHKGYCNIHAQIYITENFKTNGVKCIQDHCENIIRKHWRGMCFICYREWKNKEEDLRQQEDFENWRRRQMIARPNNLFLNKKDETPENLRFGKALIAFLDSKGLETSKRIYKSA